MESSDNDEVETVMTRREFFLSSINKFYVNHIPVDSLKDLPNLYKYIFGTFAYIVYIVFFVFFAVTSYQGSLASYLSLQNDGGCVQPSIAVTGNYQAGFNSNDFNALLLAS